MPSTKPFVISYIAKEAAEALRNEAEVLSELAAFYRSEGFVESQFGVPWGRVQPGQVAVVQIQHGLALWPSALQRAMPDALRPVRQRWLLELALHGALTRRAKACNRSLSDLVARMVQPLDPRSARKFDVENAGLRFVPPAWAQAVAQERLGQIRRAARAEQRKRRLDNRVDRPDDRWPWRKVEAEPDAAKRAYRQWVLAFHPDRGGDPERFILGKDDFERMQMPR